MVDRCKIYVAQRLEWSLYIKNWFFHKMQLRFLYFLTTQMNRIVEILFCERHIPVYYAYILLWLLIDSEPRSRGISSHENGRFILAYSDSSTSRVYFLIYIDVKRFNQNADRAVPIRVYELFGTMECPLFIFNGCDAECLTAIAIPAHTHECYRQTHRNIN